MYQNAGEKGRKHTNLYEPPCRRANKVRGHGTWDRDRVPIAGVVGRESQHLHLMVCRHSNRATLQPFVESKTQPQATVNTDDGQAYDQWPQTGQIHKTVCHMLGQCEWARDDDGDGVREVHCNTLESIWTSWRNFMRPFRGVNKVYLSQYVALFAWTYNLKHVTGEWLRTLIVLSP